jgi:hypothetical protein
MPDSYNQLKKTYQSKSLHREMIVVAGFTSRRCNMHHDSSADDMGKEMVPGSMLYTDPISPNDCQWSRASDIVLAKARRIARMFEVFS